MINQISDVNEDFLVKNESKIEKKEENSQTWLVFVAGTKKYALLSSDVQEILRNVPVFPLPFVPNYIDGVLNRYGEPYAVIDPLPLLGEQPQSSKLFIVLQGKGQVCLKVSEVVEFFTILESELKYFSNSEAGKYYAGSFSFKNEEILILNPQAFIEVAEKGVEQS